MRESDLPSPGIGAKGHVLRRIMVQAISAMQVSAPHYSNGQHPAAAALSAFLTASKAAVDLLNLITPVMTFTPTAKTYSIGTGVTAGPTVGKGGSAGAVTYASSDTSKATVNASTGAVTPIAVGTTTITATMAATATYRAATKTYVATITA